MLTVVSGSKSYAVAASTRKEMKTVECPTSLIWVFLEHPLRTVLSSICSSGGPGSVLASTQASSRRSRRALADAPVPCDPAKKSETAQGSANPSKTASKGSANPSKTASKGSAVPSKTAPKGSAGPLKTAPKGSAGPVKTAPKGSEGPLKTAPKGSEGPLKTVSSKDGSSSSRSSPTAVRVGRVLVDVELHPNQ